MEPSEVTERPETTANRDGKLWTLESVVHEVNNALVPAKHQAERAPYAEGSDLVERCQRACAGIQRVLNMAAAIAKQLESEQAALRPMTVPGRLYREPAMSIAAQAAERGVEMPAPGVTAGHLRTQGYVIDPEMADDEAILYIDKNSPTGFVWKPAPKLPPEFSLAV